MYVGMNGRFGTSTSTGSGLKDVVELVGRCFRSVGLVRKKDIFQIRSDVVRT